jgi:hypothetical protein
VSGDNGVVGGEIETSITFVVSGASEKNTSGRSGCQFVSSFGEDIRIAGTIEHRQVLVRGGDSMRVKYGLVMLITLVRRQSSRYVAV